MSSHSSQSASSIVLTDFTENITELSTALKALKTSFVNQSLMSRANYINLAHRMHKINYKIKDLADDLEELQYDIDVEDIKDNPDPEVEKRIVEFEKTYNMLTPVLGLALISYINRYTL